ncbi:TetR/AcrR family transcriptional regulator [Elizabethkingia meningoseptica]|uniref:TetR family transcriptional regulator n=1 Tax=Elizabethkingia meningoseptica TaxID=238 RepID=A0A1T3FG55_ELIME|nr:TetR/AcrR family transcriptional regulator [Elizabethkingia meningoseptica]AQX13003.1 TetR family transcriptional regulator [Elizabethkingia meningoseptica]MBG0514536.1 TetR/AcrR family transcriptional regulator [Elizabethkingia meningoseptica]MDE5433451.1 TetR/AcrR family transcriptional regulator [Elizabethkingia meningoseptica]OOH94166.1 TetR family transcriptional regulator [Elizabethkingia meningoseptica]OPB76770.1 TetR family transcriptional regulator [Elizabethkingia meningoseptica]
MSTEVKKEDTEELIKQTAKQLFFGEGRFKATSQEIADAAGVNRTSINYYFRSRDNLFNIVFEEAMQQMNQNHNAILLSDLPFKEKLGSWLEDELASAIQYPFLEIYIVTQIASNKGKSIKDEDHIEAITNVLEKELTAEIEKGTIRPISTIQFMLNIASLVSFPTCMRPLVQESFKLNDGDFEQILKERKQVILDTIFIK